jgi:hypothetical protein
VSIETENISVPKFLKLFRRFSASDKIKIADQIDRETFDARWTALDTELPDVALLESEIMNEVRAVRYAKKEDR